MQRVRLTQEQRKQCLQQEQLQQALQQKVEAEQRRMVKLKRQYRAINREADVVQQEAAAAVQQAKQEEDQRKLQQARARRKGLMVNRWRQT